mmetsp:Transcript_33496/g.75167  ORF Transcript_33496/g.75167 Transcript_33496/m.75167 type:complete len:229 (-) Transcript_33496:3314-4000(-)
MIDHSRANLPDLLVLVGVSFHDLLDFPDERLPVGQVDGKLFVLDLENHAAQDVVLLHTALQRSLVCVCIPEIHLVQHADQSVLELADDFVGRQGRSVGIVSAGVRANELEDAHVNDFVFERRDFAAVGSPPVALTRQQVELTSLVQLPRQQPVVQLLQFPAVMERIQNLCANVFQRLRLSLSRLLVDDLPVALQVLLPQRLRDLPVELSVRMQRADKQVPVVLLLQRV